MENESHADGLLNDSSPTSTAHLHLDIIYIILSFLPRQELVRAMTTCHTLNNAGVRHLLNFDVHLYSARKIESFCAFMVAQAPLRYPLLHQLSLIGFDTPVSPESINQLVEILTHASRLETLCLSSYALLKSDHRLQAACSSLTSLKEFIISSNWEPVSWRNGSLYKIEDLTVAGVRWIQSELQFPRVRKLSLSGIDHPPLALIARNFPNLTDLTIIRDIDHLDVADHLNEADHQYRQLNRSVQLAGGGWKSLDRVAGKPVDLYRLGLTCQIHRVEISSVDRDTYRVVAHVLSDSRPSYVHIGLNSIFPCVRYIPDEVAARLTYLRCTINLTYFFEKSYPLDRFYLLLQCSPLTHFMLQFNADGRNTRGVMFIRQFRPELFASQIIASHPSIRYIFIKANRAKPLFWKPQFGDLAAKQSADIVSKSFD
ncbi:hypothetical protein A0H81_08795 [Grifola frondosa]|uniref:F-box domain-containing protein n=1 Tax=Grifola frondosa TaxID=5627 RepID=A0A1C7M5K6_GRIFR|nr:hypothetical protein A0H81_08795 [Grifola frondosa]